MPMKCDPVDGRTKEETSRGRGKSDGETRDLIDEDGWVAREQKGMIVW